MRITERITVIPGKTGGSDSGFLAVGGIYFFHGCDEILNVIYPPAGHSQRHIQHPQITVDLYQVAQRDFFQNHHVAAVKHQDDGQCIGENFEYGNIFHPDPGGLNLGFLKTVVFDLEFFSFIIFFCEGLYHAVAADILLDESIQ